MHKKAFTIMELLIVVLIIGIVYTVAITNFQKINDTSVNVNLENLKSFLNSIEHKNEAKLLCLENCQECFVLVDGEYEEKYNEAVENIVDESVEVYRYELLGGVFEKPSEVYINSEDVEEDVCFSYSVDYRGAGDQVLVKFKEKVYDYSYYLNGVKAYDSLQEAQDAKEELFERVMR